MEKAIGMRQLLEAGVHYGHQTRRWNPKMAPYIYCSRNGIHIIDLQKTVKMHQRASAFLTNITEKGGHVLFVGTKRLARNLIQEEAHRAGMYFINHRWLGGTLTNFQTIRQSIHRLKKIERMANDGTFQQVTKKEALGLTREQEKLERNIGGIKDMPGLPAAVFIIDAHKESIAVAEANRLNIPVVALTDTNSDPTAIDFIIPGNDDSIKSISLFIKSAVDSCLEGKNRAANYQDENESDSGVLEGSFRDEKGNKVEIMKK